MFIFCANFLWLHVFCRCVGGRDEHNVDAVRGNLCITTRAHIYTCAAFCHTKIYRFTFSFISINWFSSIHWSTQLCFRTNCPPIFWAPGEGLTKENFYIDCHFGVQNNWLLFLFILFVSKVFLSSVCALVRQKFFPIFLLNLPLSRSPPLQSILLSKPSNTELVSENYRFSFLTNSFFIPTLPTYCHTFFCGFLTLRPSYFNVLFSDQSVSLNLLLVDTFCSKLHFWPFQHNLFEKLVYISDKSASLNLDFQCIKNIVFDPSDLSFFSFVEISDAFFCDNFPAFSILTCFQLLYRHFCNTLRMVDKNWMLIKIG